MNQNKSAIKPGAVTQTQQVLAHDTRTAGYRKETY